MGAKDFMDQLKECINQLDDDYMTWGLAHAIVSSCLYWPDTETTHYVAVYVVRKSFSWATSLTDHHCTEVLPAVLLHVIGADVFTEYPWTILNDYKNLKIFLFLPSYSHPPPYASKLIRKYCWYCVLLYVYFLMWLHTLSELNQWTSKVYSDNVQYLQCVMCWCSSQICEHELSFSSLPVSGGSRTYQFRGATPAMVFGGVEQV